MNTKLLLSSVCTLALFSIVAQAESGTNRFGFAGPEIFPIENQISLLHAADIDGDGLNDLVVVNNARSKIMLLFNQTGKTNRANTAKPRGKRELNELPPDSRFRIDSIASEKRIAAMAVTDLNGDGRPDIAYYGEPKEFVVIYNQGSNTWSTPKRWQIDDVQLTPNALTTGDLNGDGLPDIVLLAESHLHFLAQKADHTLAEPEKIPLSSLVKSIQVLDVDGDKRKDLLQVNWDNAAPFRFRLQNADGQLGPDHYFTLPPIHSYCADVLEENSGTFFISVAQNSGRAQISKFRRKPAESLSGDFKQGQFQVLPLNKTDKSRRGMHWADVNADGRTDLLVAEPERGQVSVYFQKPDGDLASPRAFPALAGVSDIAVADWDGDGKAEIFLLSPDERQIGVTRFDDKGRLPFPTLISTDGKPLAFAVGALSTGAKPSLAVLVDQEREGKSVRTLVTRTADGKSKSQKLDESFKSNPSMLVMHDADQDGLTDLIALIPYEKVKVLLQVAGKDFYEQDVAPPGGVIEQPWATTADVDGDGKSELLLPQKNFLRAVLLKQEAGLQSSTNKPGWVFQVKDQINGAASNSRLVGATAIPRAGSSVPSLFMLDAERKSLTLCERDAAGVWQVIKNVALPVSDFTTLRPVAFGSTTANTVALLGANAIGWMPLAGDVWEFTSLDGYETPIKDGYLNDMITGDLDSDGRKDVVFMETAKNHLDLVIFDANHKLVPADRWQVFEQKSFRGRGSEQPEPREALVADLTGDGKNDLAVVVHDRVLVYPQE